MNHLKALPLFTVQISNDSTYMGSAVLVKIEDTFYVLTAAHVPFGENCEQYDKNPSSTLTYESEQFGALEFVKELGNIDIYKAYDILAIEVKPNINSEDFPDIYFTSDTDYPELEYIFKGKPRGKGESIAVKPCSKNSSKNHNVKLKIPIDFYTDFLGNLGAEILQGFSGSGVFIHDDDSNDVYLTSIVRSVENDNFVGVNCTCISLFKEHLIPNIELFDFDGVVKPFTREQERIIKNTPKNFDEYHQPIEAVEATLKANILNYESTIIVGFGGIGKSNICNSLLHQTKNKFQLAFWIDASTLKKLEDLGSVDIKSDGNKINILFLLKSRSCLLILDDLFASFSKSELSGICGSRSVILASRKELCHDDDYKLPLIDNDVARRILERDIKSKCPDHIFTKLYSLIGGYPLLYALMNANLRGGYTWDYINDDCDAINQYADDSKRLLVERTLGHVISRLGTEFSFIKACKSKVIDKEFAMSIIRPIGISNLEQSTILARSSDTVLKIHDVIYEVLEEIDYKPRKIQEELNTYLTKKMKTDWISFTRMSYIHQELISDYINTTPIFLYSHLNSTQVSELEKINIPLPITLLMEIKKSDEIDIHLHIELLIKSMEISYLQERDVSYQAAQDLLSEHNKVFEELLEIKKINNKIRLKIEHHYGKSLVRTRHIEEAEPIFYNLSFSDSPMRESQLQLARIYSKSGRTDEAYNLMTSILDSFKSDNSASISVMLATFELAFEKTMQEYKTVINDKYAVSISKVIQESLSFGFSHAYYTFAKIANDWAYNKSNIFLSTFAYLPWVALSTIRDDKTKNDLGNIYLQAGKLVTKDDKEEAVEIFNQALKFYQPSTNFIKQKCAEIYLLKEDYETAKSLYLELITPEKKDPFLYFGLAKTELKINIKNKKCLDFINTAIDSLTSYQSQYKSAFLDVKSDILSATSREEQIYYLKEAIDCCNSHKFKGELVIKLNEIEYSYSEHLSLDQRD